MAYTKSGLKLGNGSTVSVAGTMYEGAITINLPNNEAELVEITTIGSTRKEYTLGILDSEEIVFTVPFGTVPTISSGADNAGEDVSIFLAGPNKTIAFKAIIKGWKAGSVENGKTVTMDIVVKPVAAPAVS